MTKFNIPNTTINDLKVREKSGAVAKSDVYYYQGNTPICAKLIGFDHSAALVRTPADGLIRVPKDTPARVSDQSAF